MDAERQADNDARRKERDDVERERITARLRRKFLVTGGIEAAFNERRAELVAEEMQRFAQVAEERRTAQAHRRVARAF